MTMPKKGTESSEQIDREIAAFNAQRPILEEHHNHKFVVFKDGQMRGAFDTLDHAAEFARAHLGAGPYLIRQVGIDFGPLPASVLYHPIAAH